MVAATYGHEDLVKFLVEVGAHVLIRNKVRATALRDVYKSKSSALNHRIILYCEISLVW